MPFSSRKMTPADWAAIRNFSAREFRFPSLMGWQFMMWLDELRTRAGVPIVISSDHRTADHNTAVGGASDSAHIDIPTDCVDIAMRPRPDDPNWNYSRYMIVKTAIEMGCQRIGTYDDGSLHLDRTEDRRPAPRMWRVVRGH